jgi:ankyrin repeat protein
VVNHSDKLAKQTPLFYSARKGHLDMCKALVELGCDVSHTDSNNKTAAEYAKKNKFQEVADYLLSETKKIK